jgi:hypothetical protein
MTDEIRQLSNVSFKMTDEVISRNWMSVNARKTRLLSLSDWTQLSDVNLPQNTKNVWRLWRSKVRAVKRSVYSDPTKAMEALKSLEQQIPEGISDESLAEVVAMPPLPNPEMDAVKQELTDFVRSHVDAEVTPKFISMEDVERLIDMKLQTMQTIIFENFQLALDKKLDSYVRVEPQAAPSLNELRIQLLKQIDTSFARPPHDEELFQEAVDFVSDRETTSSFPLLTLHANSSGFTLNGYAQEIINYKRHWLKACCEKDALRLKYREQALSIDSVEKLQELQLAVQTANT